MSAQNKILICLAAIIAFVIGITVNKARVSDDIDTATLLSAQLIVSDPFALQNNETESSNFVSADSSLSDTVEDSFSSTVEDSLSSTVEDSLGELTLVNFWATWCAPCRQEMPLFESMYRQANPDGFVVIGIALDSPERAQPMLDSMDISYPILYAEKTGNSIMQSVGNPQGLLPYSLLLDENGKVVDQVLGQIHEQQIADWIVEYL